MHAPPQTANNQKMHDLSLVPNNESLTVVATGSYIGEGFDQKRFDTLLLAAPVSFEGVNCCQYSIVSFVSVCYN